MNNLLGLVLKLCAAQLLFTSWLLGQHGAPPRSSNVVFRIIDHNGTAVSDCRVTQFLERRLQDETTRFDGLRATDIPYGQYTFEIQRRLPGGREGRAAGSVSVSVPETLVIVVADSFLLMGASADRAIPSGFVIRGKLEPVPVPQTKEDPVWIRLQSVYGSERVDVNVDLAGGFRIYRPLSGRFLLTVLEGDQVLYIEQVYFEDADHMADLVLKIPAHAPQVLQVKKTN
jgi:hypothetical protein